MLRSVPRTRSKGIPWLTRHQLVFPLGTGAVARRDPSPQPGTGISGRMQISWELHSPVQRCNKYLNIIKPGCVCTHMQVHTVEQVINHHLSLLGCFYFFFPFCFLFFSLCYFFFFSLPLGIAFEGILISYVISHLSSLKQTFRSHTVCLLFGLRRASFRRNCYCFFAFPWESFSFGNHSTNVRYAKNTVKTVLEFANIFFFSFFFFFSQWLPITFSCVKTEVFLMHATMD